MAVSAINSVSLQGVGKTAVQPPAIMDKASFPSAISDFLQDANTQQLRADQSLQELVTGQSENVHDVVVSMAKADLSFRLMLEIRNRLVESYQEVMRMQV